MSQKGDFDTRGRVKRRVKEDGGWGYSKMKEKKIGGKKEGVGFGVS